MHTTAANNAAITRFSTHHNKQQVRHDSAEAAFFSTAQQNPRLSVDEIKSLFASRAEALCTGNRKQLNHAVTRLVRAHHYLAAQVIGGYKGHVDYAELISACNHALLQAISGYHAESGTPFPAYAAQWLKQAAARAQRKSRCGSAPFNYRAEETGRRLRAVAAEMSIEQGRTPTMQELAERCHMRVSEVREKRYACLPGYSLQQPLQNDSTRTYADILADGEAGKIYDALNTRQTQEILLHNIRLFLSDNEQHTLLRRWGLEGEASGFATIAEELGVSPTRVKQYYRHACDTLRKLPALQELHHSLCA